MIHITAIQNSFRWLLVIIFFLQVSISLGNSNNPDVIKCPFDLADKNFDFNSSFKTISPSNINSKFPYHTYIDSASWWNFNTISATFSVLDSIQLVDHALSEIVLRTCLIDTLLKNDRNHNLDSLELLLTYSEKYFSYAEAHPKLAGFFGQVADSWCIYVANQLAEMAKTDKSIKHSFKFKYVAQRSRCLMYPPDISQDKLEKLERDFSEGSYLHILKRYWYGTSPVFIIITALPGLILLLLFLYGCICIIQKHLKKSN